VSVDTYLKGKNTQEYHKVSLDDVEILVAPSLAGMSERIDLGLKQFLMFKFFSVDVAVKGHQHSLA
jgi:hypothetical protein